jgi:hypothetical protein
MQQSDLSMNAQTLYNLVMHFIEKTPRDDEPDPNYREGMEIIKQECKSIVDILEQDSVPGNFKSLIKIYIPGRLEWRMKTEPTWTGWKL